MQSHESSRPKSANDEDLKDFGEIIIIYQMFRQSFLSLSEDKNLLLSSRIEEYQAIIEELKRLSQTHSEAKRILTAIEQRGNLKKIGLIPELDELLRQEGNPDQPKSVSIKDIPLNVSEKKKTNGKKQKGKKQKELKPLPIYKMPNAHNSNIQKEYNIMQLLREVESGLKNVSNKNIKQLVNYLLTANTLFQDIKNQVDQDAIERFYKAYDTYINDICIFLQKLYEKIHNNYKKTKKLDGFDLLFVVASKVLIITNNDYYKLCVYNIIGATFTLSEKFTLACSAFDNALKLNPKDVECLYNRARAKEGLGKIEEAIDDINKGLELDEDVERINGRRSMLAKLQEIQLKKSASQEEKSEVIEIEEGPKEALQKREEDAKIALEIIDPKAESIVEAKNIVDGVAQKKKNEGTKQQEINPLSKNEMSDLYNTTEEIKDQINQLLNAAREGLNNPSNKYPEQLLNYVSEANILFQEIKNQLNPEKIDEFNKIYDTTINDFYVFIQDLHKKISNNYSETKKLDEEKAKLLFAISYKFLKMANVDTYKPRIYNYIGVIYVLSNELILACFAFDNGLKLNPSQTDCLYNRAKAKEGLDKIKEAIDDLNRALELEVDVRRRKPIQAMLTRLQEKIQLNKSVREKDLKSEVSGPFAKDENVVEIEEKKGKLKVEYAEKCRDLANAVIAEKNAILKVYVLHETMDPKFVLMPKTTINQVYQKAIITLKEQKESIDSALADLYQEDLEKSEPTIIALIDDLKKSNGLIDQLIADFDLIYNKIQEKAIKVSGSR